MRLVSYSFDMYLFYCYKIQRKIYYIYYVIYGAIFFNVSFLYILVNMRHVAVALALGLISASVVFTEMLFRSQKYKSLNAFDVYVAWQRFLDEGLRYIILRFVVIILVLCIIQYFLSDNSKLSVTLLELLTSVMFFNILFLHLGSKSVSTDYREKLLGNQ